MCTVPFRRILQNSLFGSLQLFYEINILNPYSLNHFLYRGEESFKNKFRVLIAGKRNHDRLYRLIFFELQKIEFLTLQTILYICFPGKCTVVLVVSFNPYPGYYLLGPLVDGPICNLYCLN